MALAWMERSRGALVGVDHLGLRVAGESAYSQLFDFTTSVSWRPRYYSFLCWSLRRAFQEAGGRPGSPVHTLDLTTWRRAVKRRDYALAAASLLDVPNAPHIAGSRALKRALAGASEAPLPVKDNHLRSATGSLGVYAGPMRLLGLLDTAHQVDRPSPLGNTLADAFERSLATTPHADLLRKAAAEKTPGALNVAQLEQVGSRCGLAQLSSAAESSADVARERQALRDVIVDWEGLRAGSARVQRRLHSIGIVLELHRVHTAAPVTSDVFRACTLLDGVDVDGEVVRLSLPDSFAPVRANWRIYQAHAYATYALEALLGLVLRTARRLAETYGAAVPRAVVLGTLIAALPTAPASDLPRSLSGWWEWPLSRVESVLERLVEQGLKAPLTEPHMETLAWNAYWAEEDAAIHHAALLLLVATVRMRALLVKENAWLGERDGWRLPPSRLVAHLQQAIASGMSASAYLERCLGELVIQQHVGNALRKLAADPDKDSARLHVEGNHLLPLLDEEFVPGTSSPRFENVVAYLQDLGFLSPGEAPTLTADGSALLAALKRGQP